MNPAVNYLSGFEQYVPYVPTELPLANGQTWDQKNLNTTVYRDGTPIPTIRTTWQSITIGAWRFPNDDSTNGINYGRLYNFYAINGIYDNASNFDPNLRKTLAPAGWRLATQADWDALSTFLGGNSLSGGKLKETGTTYWNSPNTGATNEVNFNGRGAGAKNGADSTTFDNFKLTGEFWVSYLPSVFPAKAILSYTTNDLTFTSVTNVGYNRGMSLRLIKEDVIIPGFITTYSYFDANSIDAGGSIPVGYAGNIIERGVVWDTVTLPNIVRNAANKITSGTGTGTYSATISGLTPNTLYYFRAYAIVEGVGTSYAVEQAITTQNSLPLIQTTSPITSIQVDSAVGGGNITYIDPEYPVTVSGLVWSTSINPTIALPTKTTDGLTGSTIGSFTSTITGLAPTTHYYVRAYASNTQGTSYGANVEFDTIAGDSLKYAYSIRRVVPGYTGPGIQVRKGTSTTLLQDFSFDAITGELNQAAILSFVGPTDIGYVSKWYDQSGNGNTLGVTNVVPGREPRIVESNAVITKNGRLALRFLGGLNYLRSATFTNISENNLSGFMVFASNTTGVAQNITSIGGTFIARPISDGNEYVRYAGANRILLGVTDFNNKIYSTLTTPTGVRAWKNNISLGAETAITSTNTATTINLGYQSIGGVFASFNGTMQEVLFYIGDVGSRSTITTNAMTYYSIT